MCAATRWSCGGAARSSSWWTGCRSIRQAAVAERIRSAVAAPAQPTVTVSIGLAAAARPDLELSSVITAADAAMYEAKALGGDRVVVTAGAR